MKWSFLLAILPALFLPARVLADAGITGTVTTGSGIPLAGVRIDAEISGNLTTNAAITGVTGSFSIPIKPGYAANRCVSVALIVTKENFDSQNVVRKCSPTQAPSWDVGQVRLAASSGSSALSKEEKDYYAKNRSAEGNTLFLLPFKAAPGGQPGVVFDMENLSDSLQLAIGSWITSLSLGDKVLEQYPPFEPISVVHLKVKGDLSPSDIEKVKRVGQELNALAVAGGTGEVSEGKENVVDITSRYVIIPVDNQGARFYQVQDEGIPVKHLLSPRLSNKLSPQWAHNTLIAVCRREIVLALAQSQKNRPSLERARAYLLAERSKAGKLEKLKVQELDSLLDLVNKSLGP